MGRSFTNFHLLLFHLLVEFQCALSEPARPCLEIQRLRNFHGVADLDDVATTGPTPLAHPDRHGHDLRARLPVQIDNAGRELADRRNALLPDLTLREDHHHITLPEGVQDALQFLRKCIALLFRRELDSALEPVKNPNQRFEPPERTVKRLGGQRPQRDQSAPLAVAHRTNDQKGIEKRLVRWRENETPFTSAREKSGRTMLLDVEAQL